MTLNQRAIALLRELVKSFPQFGTDEPINGADAVDIIGVLVGKAQDLLAENAKEQRALRRATTRRGPQKYHEDNVACPTCGGKKHV